MRTDVLYIMYLLTTKVRVGSSPLPGLQPARGYATEVCRLTRGQCTVLTYGYLPDLSRRPRPLAGTIQATCIAVRQPDPAVPCTITVHYYLYSALTARRRQLKIVKQKN